MHVLADGRRRLRRIRFSSLKVGLVIKQHCCKSQNKPIYFRAPSKIRIYLEACNFFRLEKALKNIESNH